MSVKQPFFLLMLALLFCHGASAYDVLVSVTGNIIGNTCVISSDSKQVNVPLGNIGTRQFMAGEAVSNIKTPFTLSLEECGPTFVGVKVRFSGSPDINNPQLLKTDENGATGVAVEILDEHSRQIPLNTQTEVYGARGSERVEMKFYARLRATDVAVTPGDVTALATWLVEYQ